MSISIRAANLDSDRGSLIEALNQWLAPQTEARFDWLYRNGPHGRACAWVATENGSGSILGAAGIFPRLMRSERGATTGYVLGDFFVVPHHRTLGLALQLQRACLNFIETQRAPWYDFPAPGMLSVYKRLGIQPNGELVRFAKPLRADRIVRQKIKNPILAKGVSAAANLALASAANKVRAASGCEIASFDGLCSEEFTNLLAEVKSGLAVDRSADYLNWRYRTHFANQFVFLAARRQGRLVGWLVYQRQGEDAEIVDLFSAEPKVREALVRATLRRMTQENVFTVSFSLLGSHPWASELKEIGFRPRESCPAIFRGAAKTSKPDDWFLTQGDRES